MGEKYRFFIKKCWKLKEKVKKWKILLRGEWKMRKDSNDVVKLNKFLKSDFYEKNKEKDMSW